MAANDRRNVMQDLTVREAMRRLTIHLGEKASLEKVISYTIKYKVNDILVTDAGGEALGKHTSLEIVKAERARLHVAIVQGCGRDVLFLQPAKERLPVLVGRGLELDG